MEQAQVSLSGVFVSHCVCCDVLIAKSEKKYRNKEISKFKYVLDFQKHIESWGYFSSLADATSDSSQLHPAVAVADTSGTDSASEEAAGPSASSDNRGNKKKRKYDVRHNIHGIQGNYLLYFVFAVVGFVFEHADDNADGCSTARASTVRRSSACTGSRAAGASSAAYHG